MVNPASAPDARRKRLTHQVFTAEAGAELLREWERQFLNVRTFNSDPYECAARAARKDFVSDIRSTIEEVKQWK